MGTAKAGEGTQLLPRQFMISGNTVQFSMPENFSRDFPAEDMRENIDLNDASMFSQHGGVMVLQRYWDFFSGGLFKKSTGTLQMTVIVKKSRLEPAADLADPENLVEAVIRDMHLTYDNYNQNKSDDDKVMFSSYSGQFVEFKYNNQRWFRYSIWKNNQRELTSVFAIPVTSDHYLTVAFAFAPSSRLAMREFIDDYAQPQIDRIMESFRVRYDLSNSAVKAIEKYATKKLSEILQ